MNSCATCRLNSMLWERCLAMLSSFESPAHPVKSLTSNCPAPGAHSTRVGGSQPNVHPSPCHDVAAPELVRTRSGTVEISDVQERVLVGSALLLMIVAPA